MGKIGTMLGVSRSKTPDFNDECEHPRPPLIELTPDKLNLKANGAQRK